MDDNADPARVDVDRDREPIRAGRILGPVVISTRFGESLTEEQARTAVDAMRRSLGAEHLQYKAALHFD